MSDRLLAMVATREAPQLDPGRLLSSLSAYLDAGDPRPDLVTDDAKEAGSLVLTIGPFSIAILMFPFAIPDETLADALGNELVWKEAGQAFAAAKGHVLLAVVNPASDARQAVDQARLLTVAAAAVLEAAAGLGVFWAPAQTVIPPDRFVEEARALATSAFAPGLWFGFRFYPGPDHDRDNRIVCQSRGLEVFLGREVECGPYDLPPGELAEKVIGIARYMATSGPIFADGHTFGFGDDSKDARLRFRWSPLGGVNKPVFGIELLSHSGAGR